MKTYGAISPDQIIELFAMREALARLQAAGGESKEYQIMMKSEAETWKEAISILRDTEFVGWNNASPIAGEPVTVRGSTVSHSPLK